MPHMDHFVRVGPAEILPLKTPTVPPYTTTNTVAYGNNSFIIVDPGTPYNDQQEILYNYVAARIKRGNRFFGIYLTHHHGDHSKGTTFLREAFGVEVSAHKNASRYLKFPVDRELLDREEIVLEKDIIMQALYTPGHADDHMVFFDDKAGILIAGDMITDRGTVLIPPGTGSLRVYLESLESLTKLNLTTIIPAHGQAITEKPVVFLLTAIKHRLQRVRSVLEVLMANPDALFDVMTIAFLVYKSLSSKNLLIFAQLSVESSLAWLQDMKLAQKVRHRWQVAPHTDVLKEEFVSRPLKEIDDRLRNA